MGAQELWLVRHGESIANRAAAAAESEGLDTISVQFRDADVPLSDLGRRQAEALGSWLATNAASARPPSVWVSSYRRAIETTSIALRAADLDVQVRVDERLRDRELGILDLLTSGGVERLHPAEAERRRWLGKYYYRPPGGESWADVALRVRSILNDLDLATETPDPGVIMIAAHDAVVMVFLSVCLSMSEAELMEFARTNTVTNASVTRLIRPSSTGPWTLDSFSTDDHLRDMGISVTKHAGDNDDDRR